MLLFGRAGRKWTCEGALNSRHMPADVLDHFGLAHRRARLGHDEGHHVFAIHRVGHADHGRFGHAGMLVQHRFQLGRIRCSRRRE